MDDKLQAFIDFIITCPQIRDNPLFFNFIQAKDNNKQLVTSASDRSIEKPYIDGSVMKRFTYTIIDYRSIAYQALVKLEGYANENVEEYLDVQSIVDWIEEQNDANNYPNFGSDCIIESMRTTSSTPNLNGVDTSLTPALAKYSIAIQIDYIDNSKKLFN